MARMMAQLTTLAGQGAVAAGGQPPVAPPAATPAATTSTTNSTRTTTTTAATPQVQVAGATGRHWKPPNASDVQMLDSDVTPQSLKRWRRVWESFQSQHDLVGYPKHQQYGTLMSRLTIALQRIIDVRCSVDLDDKNQTPTEILDSLAAYMKSAQQRTIWRSTRERSNKASQSLTTTSPWMTWPTRPTSARSAETRPSPSNYWVV